MTDPVSADTPSAVPADPETGHSADAQHPPRAHHERRTRAIGWHSKDVLRAAALVIAMYVALKLLWVANPLFLTAFLGVLFGLAVSSGVDALQRFHIPRGPAAGLIVITCLGLLVGFGAWVAPTLREQGTELRRQLPHAIDRVENWVNNQRGGFFGAVLGLESDVSPDSAAATAARQQRAASDSAIASGPRGAAPSTNEPTTLSARIGSQLSGATKYLFPFLSSTVAAVGGLLLVIFLAIYIAADPGLYRKGVMHLFPHPSRERAGEVLSAMATMLRRWLVTQLIAMVAIGTVTTIVLLVLGIKAAFALGVLAGLLEFIPTLGPILSAVPAIAMGFLDSPEKALYVMIAYIGIQFAENQLLIPLLMKGGVDLPPAVTILAQALMVLVFGFLGLLVAVPLIVAVMVAVKMLYVEGVVGDDVDVLGDDDDDDSGGGG